MMSLMLVVTVGMEARVRVNASSDNARVADAGASSPLRAGGFVIILPPQKTTQ